MITIIPAIDIINGKCVRLTRGDFQSKKIYDADPLRVAKSYEDAGIQRLHLVDLDGARQKRIVNWRVLETIANQTGLQIDFGGGIQLEADLQLAFNSGAAQVTAGSIAAKEPETVRSWLKKYGSEKIILGADVKAGKIAINAWQEETDRDLLAFLDEYFQAGIRYTICTDISRDGLLQGPAFELYSSIKQRFPQLYLIASGGVSNINDVKKLAALNINGVIIGKALYEGNIQLKELEHFLC
jgi:phosphoribosylformimino-5-aminoimidazole carboxamide ribotide isomerase